MGRGVNLKGSHVKLHPRKRILSPLTLSLPFVERKLQTEALYTKYQIYRAALSGNRGRRVCTETCSLLLVPQKLEQSVKEFKDQRGSSTNLNLLNTKNRDPERLAGLKTNQ